MKWRSINDFLDDDAERENADTSRRGEEGMDRARREAELEMARRVQKIKRIATGYTADKADRENRNEHVIELWAMGFDRHEIAELVDLTPQRISQIVNSFGAGWR